jgi:lysophospholipase L1-like esterase
MTLALLLIANLGLFAYLFLRPDPVDPLEGAPAPAAATTSSASTASPSGDAAAPSSSATEPVVTPVLAVYGDGYSSGSAAGGQGPAGWPALLAGRLGAQLQLGAAPRSGYVAIGSTGQDFADQVAATPVPDATVTIVFGSRNDLGQPVDDVSGAVTDTLDAIRSTAPDTAIVVVGPAWSNADVPAELNDQRDAVASAAAAAGATFVDPLAEGWFAEPGDLIADDGVSPTDAGHQFIADSLAPVVSGLLADR